MARCEDCTNNEECLKICSFRRVLCGDTADIRCTKFKSREMIGLGTKVSITCTPKKSSVSDPIDVKYKVDIRLEIRENDRIECYEFQNEDWLFAAVLVAIMTDAEKRKLKEQKEG